MYNFSSLSGKTVCVCVCVFSRCLSLFFCPTCLYYIPSSFRSLNNAGSIWCPLSSETTTAPACWGSWSSCFSLDWLLSRPVHSSYPGAYPCSSEFYLWLLAFLVFPFSWITPSFIVMHPQVAFLKRIHRG